MAKKVHMYTANTSRRGDNSRYLGTVKVVKSKTVRRDEDCDGQVVTLYRFRLPADMKGLNNVQIYNGLHDEYHERCSHEWDCCGCYFGGVRDVIRVSAREVAFTTSYSRNV